jgi:hypothetical protein
VPSIGLERRTHAALLLAVSVAAGCCASSTRYAWLDWPPPFASER